MRQFTLQGEYWVLEFGGAVTHLRDCAGLRQIAYLMERPGELVASADLFLVGRGSRRTNDGRAWIPPSPEQARVNVVKTICAARLRIGRHLPELAEHLELCLRTGGQCVYDERLVEHRESPTVPLKGTAIGSPSKQRMGSPAAGREEAAQRTQQGES